MAEFADGQGFNNLEFVRHPERLILYRDRAPAMIRAALAGGSPEAAMFLSIALEEDSSFLAALIPDDPVEAHALGLLLHRIGVVEREPSPRQPLDSLQLARAEAVAEGLQRQHFARFSPRPLRMSFAEDLYQDDSADCLD